jgi:peptide/nickel transport system permease protein
MSSTDAAAVKHSRAGRLPGLNRRQRTLVVIVLSAALLLGVVAGGVLRGDEMLGTNLDQRNLAPSLAHPFGTDWLGRDMLTRTLQGLTLSLVVGVLASAVSVLIAVTLGMAAATLGRTVDGAVTWLVDLFLSKPHLLVLILIALAFGGGATGVILAVALTHWPSLTRVIRAEVLQLRTAEFVQVSRRLGRSRWWIARRHLLPHVAPQILVGFVLLFPHAILHEAGITFLGFGFSPQQPAVGVILSEAMRYLQAGCWWLALFPGLALLIMVRTFHILGDHLRALANPRTAHE